MCLGDHFPFHRALDGSATMSTVAPGGFYRTRDSSVVECIAADPYNGQRTMRIIATADESHPGDHINYRSDHGHVLCMGGNDETACNLHPLDAVEPLDGLLRVLSAVMEANRTVERKRIAKAMADSLTLEAPTILPLDLDTGFSGYITRGIRPGWSNGFLNSLRLSLRLHTPAVDGGDAMAGALAVLELRDKALAADPVMVENLETVAAQPCPIPDDPSEHWGDLAWAHAPAAPAESELVGV